MSKPKKKKFDLVYAGRNAGVAQAKADAFWDSASDEARMKAVNDLVEHASALKGIKPSELRLCRTTAVIKRT